MEILALGSRILKEKDHLSSSLLLRIKDCPNFKEFWNTHGLRWCHFIGNKYS
jgi:hypothetical protein